MRDARETIRARTVPTTAGSLPGRLECVLGSMRCWSVLLASTAWHYPTRALRATVFGAGEWQRALVGWARTNVRWGGFRVEVAGLEHVRAGCVVAANHASAFDICLLAAILPEPFVFVSREEVRGVPVVGSVLVRGGHVLIRRGGGTANDAALRRAARLARDGRRVVFFPEGTRSRGGEVGAFRAGAFRVAAEAGVPLVPAALAGTRAIMPAGTPYIIPGRVSVEFLEPTEVSPTDGKSESFRDGVRARVAERVAAAGKRLAPGGTA